MNIERRLQRIKEKLNKNPSCLLDMSDDKLVQLITGNPNAKAGDITTAQLESLSREHKK